ncbi:translation initiation factor IF-2 [Candidatus Poribacteria bacterium]|nr:translation initiation factor IF-2 [Candidatus Poribacteria bacterium]
MRVHELAKQYNLTSKDLITEIETYGIVVKTHMSSLSPEDVKLIEEQRNLQSKSRETSVPLTTEDAEKPETKKAPQAEKKSKVNQHKHTTKKEKKKSKREVVEEKIIETKTIPDDNVSRQIQEGITVAKLASQLGGLKSTEVIMSLMKIGVMANVNESLDYETLVALADQFDFEPIRQLTLEDKILSEIEEEDDPKDLAPRAPVVTIMGHVDHGKTSLLDAIRNTNVIDTEAGNITQHIGAYYVESANGNLVFLDTPGHAAFTSMRARGAQVTDIVVLVVAADDGVMPQTIEAIDHAKAAGVPIIVAVNKIDVTNANPDRVKQQLMGHELSPEEWGGSTVCVEISALEGTGVEDLLEMLLLESELLELQGNPNRNAKGAILEAKLDRGRGVAATVLVQDGTLKIGDSFISGIYSGRVRAMINDQNKHLKAVGPSTPVEVLGFNGVPEAGDRFNVVSSEADARKISEKRQSELRQSQLSSNSTVTLDSLFDKIRTAEIKELNVIVKGDAQGSVQAISDELVKLGVGEVEIKIIRAAVGGITEADVLLAVASNAVVVGFNVRPTTEAMQLSTQENIDVRTYSIIYELISEMRAAMEGLLEPEVKEVIVGRAVVRETFKVPRAGTIAGSYVNWGSVSYNYPVRVLRDSVLIYEGKIESLRRFKDDVSQVATNYECGIGISDFDDVRVDDTLECYTLESVRRTLSP